LVASSLRSPERFVPCAAASTSAGVVPPAPPVTRAETHPIGSAGTCSATQSKNADSLSPPSFLPSFPDAGAGAGASCACFAAPLRRHAPSQRDQSHSGRLSVEIARAREVELELEPAPAAHLPVVRALDSPEEHVPSARTARSQTCRFPCTPARESTSLSSQSRCPTYALGDGEVAHARVVGCVRVELAGEEGCCEVAVRARVDGRAHERHVQ
jgi:hypothetical protein